VKKKVEWFYPVSVLMPCTDNAAKKIKKIKKKGQKDVFFSQLLREFFSADFSVSGDASNDVDGADDDDSTNGADDSTSYVVRTGHEKICRSRRKHRQRVITFCELNIGVHDARWCFCCR
jgi:hypothetical protein